MSRRRSCTCCATVRSSTRPRCSTAACPASGSPNSACRWRRRAPNTLAGHDVTYLVASPLERAQQTAEPFAAEFGLPIAVDDHLIESANFFEGKRVSVGDGALRDPRNWWVLRDPITPSWGEPYTGDRATHVHRARSRPRAGRRPRGACACRTSCRSGSCGASWRSSGSGTTRASGSAGSPASRRSTSPARGSPASATPNRPLTWSRSRRPPAPPRARDARTTLARRRARRVVATLALTACSSSGTSAGANAASQMFAAGQTRRGTGRHRDRCSTAARST